MVRERAHFSPIEFIIMVALSMGGTLVTVYFPMKEVATSLGLPGPFSGMALFGGLCFVFWVAIARYLVRKKFSALFTSLLLIVFCLFFGPWFGVIDPPWFSIYGVLALLALGASVEFLSGSPKRGIMGGGIGNTLCLGISWLALGYHTATWIPSHFALPMLLLAFASGSLGALIAWGVAKASGRV